MENNNYDHIHELQKRITDLEIKVLKLSNVVSDAYESLDTDLINTSLSKAQGEFPDLDPNRENPYFKSNYCDLHGLLVALRPIFAKNGLSLTQQIKILENGTTMLHSRLRHSSGQWIECRFRIVPAKEDIQGRGAAITYAKRYSLLALTGISSANDPDDDDGETEMKDVRREQAKGISFAYNAPKFSKSAETLTKEQVEEMEYELAEFPDLAEQAMKWANIQTLADFPKSHYIASMEKIRRIKLARKESK